MLDGISGIAHYQYEQILRDRHHLQAPVFPSGVSIPMDAIKKMPYMVEFADKVKLEPPVNRVLPVARGRERELLAAFEA